MSGCSTPKNGVVDVTDTVRVEGKVLTRGLGAGEDRAGDAGRSGHRLGSSLPDDANPHRAARSLSGVVFSRFGAKVTGGNMEPGVARMDFELDSMSVEFGRQVEEMLNAELVKGYPAEVVFLAREDAIARS